MALIRLSVGRTGVALGLAVVCCTCGLPQGRTPEDPGTRMRAPSVAPVSGKSAPKKSQTKLATSPGSESQRSSTALIYDRHGRLVPSEYACTLRLLEYFARNHWSIAAPDIDDAIRPDVTEAASFFSTEGVMFRDEEFVSSPIDGSHTGHSTTRVVKGTFEPSEIERQLRKRAGLVFWRLMRLGKDYAAEHPNHSKLMFSAAGTRVVVRVGGEGFELTFNVELGCRLERLDYLTIEAE